MIISYIFLGCLGWLLLGAMAGRINRIIIKNKNPIEEGEWTVVLAGVISFVILIIIIGYSALMSLYKWIATGGKFEYKYPFKD